MLHRISIDHQLRIWIFPLWIELELNEFNMVNDSFTVRFSWINDWVEVLGYLSSYFDSRIAEVFDCWSRSKIDQFYQGSPAMGELLRFELFLFRDIMIVDRILIGTCIWACNYNPNLDCNYYCNWLWIVITMDCNWIVNTIQIWIDQASAVRSWCLIGLKLRWSLELHLCWMWLHAYKLHICYIFKLYFTALHSITGLHFGSVSRRG